MTQAEHNLSKNQYSQSNKMLTSYTLPGGINFPINYVLSKKLKNETTTKKAKTNYGLYITVK